MKNKIFLFSAPSKNKIETPWIFFAILIISVIIAILLLWCNKRRGEQSTRNRPNYVQPVASHQTCQSSTTILMPPDENNQNNSSSARTNQEVHLLVTPASIRNSPSSGRSTQPSAPPLGDDLPPSYDEAARTTATQNL